MSIATPVEERAASEPPETPRVDHTRQRPGWFLRRIWRTHFYAAVIAAPVLAMFAITGLGILYTQPIQQRTLADLLTVTVGEKQVSYLDQLATAQAVHPELELTQIVPPSAADRATLFEFTDGAADFQQVFVDPYTGETTGTMATGDDIIGLANRLHGNLNTESVTVTLPNMAWVFDRELPTTVAVPISDVVLEIATVWALVLALTGLYLWWPRTSQRKPLLRVRWSKGGRLRWKDVHSTSGVLVSGFLLLFIVSGLSWSNYWGDAFSTAAAKATPNAEFLTPVSTPVEKGALNRVGSRVTWAEQGDLIPGSAVPADGSTSAPIDLETVVQIGNEEGMLPGFSIVPPLDDISDDGTTYGTYVLTNPWPSKQAQSRTLYLDQFTGRTLAESTAADWGAIQRVTDYSVALHMGTQFGVVTRTLVTLGCLAIIVSLISSILMWWKRRPRGRTGLPARQQHRTNRSRAGLGIIALVIALIYPLWGVSLITVIAIDIAAETVLRRRRTSTALTEETTA